MLVPLFDRSGRRNTETWSGFLQLTQETGFFFFQPILLTHAAQKPRKPLHSLLGLALQPPCQLSGEKDIGQLAVTVGEATIVALLTIEVMEADSASMMSQ